jgi:pSer/pThr/pTyr-binding forkhead associated (FHA) protein
MRFLPVLLLAAATSGAGQPPEPWGYLYFPRIEKLFPLALGEVTVGRLPENAVVLASPRISRRHAVLRRSAEGVALEDVGSSNGSRRNGAPLRPRDPVPLAPGDRIELADELALYHESLLDLWKDEIRNRLLARILKLRVALPKDRTKKAFGREEIELAVSSARVNARTGAASELEHTIPLESESGFPEGSGAFVGSALVEGEVLELSLWTIAASESMTGRRASFTNLKHATLRITIEGGAPAGGEAGPWFPTHLLSALFDVFPDDPEYTLNFAMSLASQTRPEALSNAAASLFFRHRLDRKEWKLLVAAAQAQGEWVDREIDERGLSLGPEDLGRLRGALEEGKAWLEEAESLGAKADAQRKAEASLGRGAERLARLEANR